MTARNKSDKKRPAKKLAPPPEIPRPRITLTPRENSCAAEWCAGRRQSEIARRLGMSQAGVAKHLASIRRKAGQPLNGVQLVLFLVLHVPAFSETVRRLGYKLIPIATTVPAPK